MIEYILLIIVICSLLYWVYLLNKKKEEASLVELSKYLGELRGRLDQQSVLLGSKLSDMNQSIDKLTSLLIGSRSRGAVGESLLRKNLLPLIESGIVIENLRLSDNRVVEFGWKLNDGKYIPIDSKFPIPEKEEHIKKISSFLKEEVDKVASYQNLQDTIDYCVLAIPDEFVSTLAGLISESALKKRVLITGYSNVVHICVVVANAYNSKSKNDLQKLRDDLEHTRMLLSKIEQSLSKIVTGKKMIDNATDEIHKHLEAAKQRID